MAAAFNLQKFPGFSGTDYHAEFTDASGLHKGNMVQVAGIRVGRVDEIELDGDHVIVDFDVDRTSTFGDETPGVGRGAQPARGEVPRPDPRGQRAAGRGRHRSRSSRTESALRHRRRLSAS